MNASREKAMNDKPSAILNVLAAATAITAGIVGLLTLAAKHRIITLYVISIMLIFGGLVEVIAFTIGVPEKLTPPGSVTMSVKTAIGFIGVGVAICLMTSLHGESKHKK